MGWLILLKRHRRQNLRATCTPVGLLRMRLPNTEESARRMLAPGVGLISTAPTIAPGGGIPRAGLTWWSPTAAPN